jgi:hypothetical protein
MMTDQPNFEQMTRNELAHYMVAHRDTPQGIEAQRVYIQRIAKKAKELGFDLYDPDRSSKLMQNSVQ